MKIDFELPSDYGPYRDALYLPDDHALSDDEIEAMKQERLTNWLSIMATPATEGES